LLPDHLQEGPAFSNAAGGSTNGAARAGGFSLHAGIDIAPNHRPKLERLCRYMSRPPVATERVALTSSGHVRYQRKTPYRNGTTHLVIELLDFMARLAALVPPPRIHLGYAAPSQVSREILGRGGSSAASAEAGASP